MMNLLITFADRRATYSASFWDFSTPNGDVPSTRKLTDNSDIQDPGDPMGVQNLYFFVFHIFYCINITQSNLKLVLEMS